MRTFTFKYVPLPQVPREEIPALLADNRNQLHRRGFGEIRLSLDPGSLTCTRGQQEDLGDCLINTYMDDRLLNSMRTTEVRIDYDDALLPSPIKEDVRNAGERYRNGEFVLWSPYPGMVVSVLVTCLPSEETVAISLKIGEKHTRNPYWQERLAILDAQSRVERVIKQTRAVRQLIQAFRTRPSNKGFVDRSIKELFRTIGQL